MHNIQNFINQNKARISKIYNISLAFVNVNRSSFIADNNDHQTIYDITNKELSNTELLDNIVEYKKKSSARDSYLLLIILDDNSSTLFSF